MKKNEYLSVRITKAILIVCFIVLNLFLSNSVLKSQIKCPDVDPCPLVPWQTANFDDYIGSGTDLMHYWGTYEWRLCNGVYQIRNYKITVSSSGSLWNNGTWNEQHFSGLKELAEIESLNQLIQTIGYEQIPDCPHTMPFASVYSAACGVWLRCSYEFPCQAIIHADGPSQTGYNCPPPWIHNGHPTVDVWHWEPCGDVCCEKTYDLCKQFDPPSASYQIVISNVNRHVLAGSSCGKQGQFFRWDTGTVINCNDGCQGDGY